MATAQTITGFIRISSRMHDPFYIFTPPKKHSEIRELSMPKICPTAPPVKKTAQIHKPKITKIYPSFPPVPETTTNNILYRIATPEDLSIILEFCDFWLSGKGYAAKVPGAGRSECFIPPSQHRGYLRLYTTLLAFDSTRLVGWAVRQREGILIHLLVDAAYRGTGIGTQLLTMLNPPTVRSKSDQHTGDPINFYLKHGYKKTTEEKTGKHHNIDVLTR